MDTSDFQIEQDRVIEQMRKQLENMSITEIDKVATKKNLVGNELKRVQTATRNAAKAALGGDGMQAYRGVRMTRYKEIQGGNINILHKRGNVKIDTRKYNGVGLTRHRFRSERSKLLASYWGESRSFVLRIQQHGTKARTAGTKHSSAGGSGNRGIILAKDFMSTARSEMQQAADNIVRQLSFIDQLFMK